MTEGKPIDPFQHHLEPDETKIGPIRALDLSQQPVLGPALPYPGARVLYVSRTGNYYLPALVTVVNNAVANNLYAPGVEGEKIPDITGPDRCHLVVFSVPFIGGEADVKVDPSWTPRIGVGYAEADIPYAPVEDMEPGTWHWPDHDVERTDGYGESW